MTRTERIAFWALTLTAEQMRPLVRDLVDFAIDGEYVCFYEYNNAPYWDGDGEPLVKGQIIDRGES